MSGRWVYGSSAGVAKHPGAEACYYHEDHERDRRRGEVTVVSVPALQLCFQIFHFSTARSADRWVQQSPVQRNRDENRSAPELQGANRSDFDMFAVVALEVVEIATRLLSLNPEQAHFQPASWAQEQGLGVRFFCCWHPASFVIRTA